MIQKNDIPNRHRKEYANMICNNCGCKGECGWYKSYEKIETEIYIGIGTDNTLGRALITTLKENKLNSCKYYEELKDTNTDNVDK